MHIVFKNLSLEDMIYCSIGAFIEGCTPILQNDRQEIKIYRENNKLCLYTRDKTLCISTGEDSDKSIVLNMKRNNVYLHFYKQRNNIIEKYVTSIEIDERIFAGLFSCILHKIGRIDEAFRKTMNILSIGAGNPFVYFRNIIESYEAYMLLSTTRQRLLEKRQILERHVKEKLVIGKKISEKQVVAFAIIKGTNSYLYECVQPLEEELTGKYEPIDPGKAFLCGISSEIGSGASNYDYDVKELTDGTICIEGEDPLELIILFEKITSSTS